MKVVLKIGAVACIALALVGALVGLSQIRSAQGAGVSRTVIASLTAEQVLPVEKGLDLAGIDDTSVYLFGRQRGWLQVFDRQHHRLAIRQFSEGDPAGEGSFVVQVSGGQAWTLPFNDKKIGMRETAKGIIKQYPVPFVFKQAVVVDNRYLVMRLATETGTDVRLARFDLQSREATTAANIFPQIGDGGMSTDGMLLYDNTTSRIIYVHYYSNLLYCLDTALCLVYRARTIDSCNSFIGKVAKKQNRYGVAFTHAAPPRFVNSAACVSDGVLYVKSKIPDERKSPWNSNRHFPVDCYQIKDGRYLGSFYMPAVDNRQPYSFLVSKGYICALYDQRLAVFRVESRSNVIGGSAGTRIGPPHRPVRAAHTGGRSAAR